MHKRTEDVMFFICSYLFPNKQVIFPELLKAINEKFPDVLAFSGTKELTDPNDPNFVYWINLDEPVYEALMNLLTKRIITFRLVQDFVYTINGFQLPYPSVNDLIIKAEVLNIKRAPNQIPKFDNNKYWCPVVIEANIT